MPTPTRQPNIAQIARRFFAAHLHLWTNPHTRRAYESRLRLGVIDLYGHLLPSDLSVVVCRELLEEAAAERGQAAAKSTRSFGARIWDYAVECGDAQGPNPWRLTKPPTQANRNYPIVGRKAERLSALLWSCFHGTCDVVGPVPAACLLTIQQNGLRASEGTHLRFTEVDFEHRVLRIAYHKGAGYSGKEKTVGFPSSTFELLTQVRDRGWDDTHVFPSGKSARGHLEDLNKPWVRIRAALGWERERVHDLRHGYAQMLRCAGVDVFTISKQLGHSRLDTTQTYLGQPTLDELHEAAEHAAGGKARSACG